MRGESLWSLNLKAWIPLDELEAVYGFLGLDRYTLYRCSLDSMRATENLSGQMFSTRVSEW